MPDKEKIDDSFAPLRKGLLEFAVRETDLVFAGHSRVTNACQHVGDGITHAHIESPAYYQLALVIPGIFPAKAISRILARAKPN